MQEYEALKAEIEALKTEQRYWRQAIKNMNSVTPVILCGGSGTRLWPLSRAGYPKQFLVLSGDQSLFQQAVARLQALGADDIVRFADRCGRN